jgi:hypothetical protein
VECDSPVKNEGQGIIVRFFFCFFFLFCFDFFFSLKSCTSEAAVGLVSFFFLFWKSHLVDRWTSGWRENDWMALSLLCFDLICVRMIDLFTGGVLSMYKIMVSITTSDSTTRQESRPQAA